MNEIFNKLYVKMSDGTYRMINPSDRMMNDFYTLGTNKLLEINDMPTELYGMPIVYVERGEHTNPIMVLGKSEYYQDGIVKVPYTLLGKKVTITYSSSYEIDNYRDIKVTRFKDTPGWKIFFKKLFNKLKFILSTNE